MWWVKRNVQMKMLKIKALKKKIFFNFPQVKHKECGINLIYEKSSNEYFFSENIKSSELSSHLKQKKTFSV